MACAAGWQGPHKSEQGQPIASTDPVLRRAALRGRQLMASERPAATGSEREAHDAALAALMVYLARLRLVTSARRVRPEPQAPLDQHHWCRWCEAIHRLPRSVSRGVVRAPRSGPQQQHVQWRAVLAWSDVGHPGIATGALRVGFEPVTSRGCRGCDGAPVEQAAEGLASLAVCSRRTACPATDTTLACIGLWTNPDEVRASSLLTSLFASDVKLFDAQGKYAPNPTSLTKDALSVGIGFTAVKALITQ